MFIAVSLRGGTTKQSILTLEIASLRSQGQALITCRGYRREGSSAGSDLRKNETILILDT